MKYIAKKVLISYLSIFVLIQLIDKITISGGWLNTLYGGVVLSALYWILKPLLNLVLFPLNLATMNLSAWLIDIVLFYLWTIVFPQVKIEGWYFPGVNLGVLILSPYTFAGWQIYGLSAVILAILLRMFSWLLK